MDKKSIAGIVIVALIFLGFTFYNSHQQKKYQEQLMAYNAEQARIQAEQDSLLALNAPLPTADSAAIAAAGERLSGDSLQAQRRIMQFGELLAAAQQAEAEEFTVENEVLKIDFSTRGGQVKDVTLKDYTKYAPRDERNQPVRLFDPATANFALTFYVKNGHNNVLVNTADYTFNLVSMEKDADGAQRITMDLPVARDAVLRYEYVVYNIQSPARDYLVDLNVYLKNMAPQMASQTTVGIDWSNRSYQNEKGFQNENTYTTIYYRAPGESSADDLGMSDGEKQKTVSSSLNWVAFKQQFFSSVMIAPENFSYADMKFTTAEKGSGYIKDFSAKLTVPYTAQTDHYNFAFYFGPNKYAILKHVATTEGDDELHLERLIPLGWGIFGWVNRWFVIPVFDFLRQFIPSFGLIILILAVLVKVIISPLTYKSYISTAKMRVIKPEVDELAKKYPRQEDAMKRQQATMELYKKAGINPMGGCIPLLIQMPIIIAMFRFFPASIELRGQHFLWADDLSSYDSVLSLPFNIPFYGDHVSLFALLMTVALFAFSYINYQQTASSQPQMAGMKFMMVYLMPVMMLLWFNSYSSGLTYYYFLANILTIGQTLVIRRMIDEGHTVAIHGYSHDYASIYKSDEAFMQNVYRLRDRLRADFGYEATIIRFPGGSSNTVSRQYSVGIMSRLAQRVQNEGFTYFDWNVSSGDAAGTPASSGRIYSAVTSALRHGRSNVVLMHDAGTKSTTADALPDIIQYCLANGYSIQAITPATKPVHHGIAN